MGVLAVDGASDGLGRAEDLLDGAGERLGERLGGELSGDLNGAQTRVRRLFLPETRSLSPRPRRLTSTISSNATFPLCLMFFSFFLSRGGSFKALMTMDEAEGTTETAACRFWIVSWTVTRRPFQSPVALAMSSPTFLGDYPGTRKKVASDACVPSWFAHHPPTHETQGTDLGSQSGRRTDLTTNGTEVDDLGAPVSFCLVPSSLSCFPTHLDFGGVDLGSHFCRRGVVNLATKSLCVVQWQHSLVVT